MLVKLFRRGGAKYFDKNIKPQCDYCHFGKRSRDGNKILCEKVGMVDSTYACGKFQYSPLKRIPVKQLSKVGFMEDEIFVESKDESAVKEEKQQVEV